MNAKPRIKLTLASRRVIVDDYTEPPQSLVVEPKPIPTLSHAPIKLGVTLIAAQPFAHPAKAKQQRSRVLARRALTKKITY